MSILSKSHKKLDMYNLDDAFVYLGKPEFLRDIFHKANSRLNYDGLVKVAIMRLLNRSEDNSDMEIMVLDSWIYEILRKGVEDHVLKCGNEKLEKWAKEYLDEGGCSVFIDESICKESGDKNIICAENVIKAVLMYGFGYYTDVIEYIADAEYYKRLFYELKRTETEYVGSFGKSRTTEAKQSAGIAHFDTFLKAAISLRRILKDNPVKFKNKGE
jgi:hypothetical protein